MNNSYVLLVNWNGWQDTIECLESVFRNDFPGYKVIVCDNGSGDGSIEHIKAWANGGQPAFVPAGHPLRHLTYPPVPKPIAWVEYGREDAEKGGKAEDDRVPLILIQTGENLGFAGGNNVGLRYALARDNFDFIWLLNNDTVIEPGALSHLVRRMEDNPDAGICGSTIPLYSKPGLLYARGGGTYNKWIAYVRHIGHHDPVSRQEGRDRVERRMDFVAGASMLVSRAVLKDIGLMSEDYFLYFEELDWAARCRGRYKLAYAPESIVYHKVGASMTTYNDLNNCQFASKNLFLENIMRFTRKFYPWAAPTVWLAIQAAKSHYFCRRQLGRFSCGG